MRASCRCRCWPTAGFSVRRPPYLAVSTSTNMMLVTAMKIAPMALVGALAETSIVFAALVWLRKPLRTDHGFGVRVMAAGVTSMRLVG